jgi:hypothetical protein
MGPLGKGTRRPFTVCLPCLWQTESLLPSRIEMESARPPKGGRSSHTRKTALMPKDIKIVATDVSLAAKKDLSALTILGRIVETTPKGPRKTANTVQLTLSARQAMNLLSQLQAVQSKYNLPLSTSPVIETAVPPAKNRN